MKKTTIALLALLFGTASHATTFIAQYVPAPVPSTPAAAAPPAASTTTPSSTPPLPPGLYVQVIDGLINVTNTGGTQNFASGQFGFTPTPIQAPVVVPKNPGLQFTPPPSFAVPPPVAGSSTASRSNAVDCEVR